MYLDDGQDDDGDDPYFDAINRAVNFDFARNEKQEDEMMRMSESRTTPFIVLPAHVQQESGDDDDVAETKGTSEEPVVKTSVTKSVKIVVGVPSLPQERSEENAVIDSKPSVPRYILDKSRRRRKPAVFLAEDLPSHEIPSPIGEWRPVLRSSHPLQADIQQDVKNEVVTEEEKIRKLLVVDPYDGHTPQSREELDLLKSVENYEPKVIPEVIDEPESNNYLYYEDHRNHEPESHFEEGKFDFRPVFYPPVQPKSKEFLKTIFDSPFEFEEIDRQDELSAPGPPYAQTPLPEHATVIPAPSGRANVDRPHFPRSSSGQRSARHFPEVSKVDFGAATRNQGGFSWYSMHPVVMAAYNH